MRKPCVALVLFSVVLAAPALAQPPDLIDLWNIADEMTPGEWHQIPDTLLRPVLITREELEAIDPDHSIWNVQGPEGVITVWTGAAFDGRNWYFFGGGHNAYEGNEIYRFNFTSLAWDRAYDPSPLRDESEWYDPANPKPVWGPASAHTYDGIIWSPRTQTLILFATSHDPGAWEWDPVIAETDPAGAWTLFDKPPIAQYDYHKTALDPVSENILVSRGGAAEAIELDPVTKTYARKSGGGGWQDYTTAEIDPDRREVFFVSGGGIWSYTVDGAALGAPGEFHDTLPAGVGTNTAVAHHPRTGTMVFWNGGREVWLFEPDTRAWTTHANATGPGPGPSISNGPFSKWIYIPEVDTFAGYDNPDEGVWLYRLPGSGPLEPDELAPAAPTNLTAE